MEKQNVKNVKQMMFYMTMETYYLFHGGYVQKLHHQSIMFLCPWFILNNILFLYFFYSKVSQQGYTFFRYKKVALK